MKDISKILSQPAKTEFQFPEKCLGELLFRTCQKNPQKICQVDLLTGQRETYETIQVRAIKAALGLHKLGIVPGDNAALFTRSSVDAFAALLAIFYTGARNVNLDPAQNEEQVRHVLEVLKPKVVFVQQEEVANLEAVLEALDFSCEIVVFGKTEDHCEFSSLLILDPDNRKVGNFRPVNVAGEDTASFMLTSGTTGTSKVVPYTHKSILYSMNVYELDRASTAMALSPTWYSSSFYTLVLLTFLSGGLMVYPKNQKVESLCKAIETEKIQQVMSWPVICSELANHEDILRKFDLSSLRSCCIVGGYVSPFVVGKLEILFRNSLFFNVYGATEVLSVTCPGTALLSSNSNTSCCGKLYSGVSLKIVDPETRTLLGANEKGEIWVKNQTMMGGYLNRKTQDCFDADGFYNMGDLGYYDEEGRIYILSRISEIIKTSNMYFTYPDALEEVLLQHPQVLEAAAFAVRLEEWEDVPAACVVLKNQKNGQDIEKTLREFSDAKLQAHERLRGGICVVEKLPKTPTDKVIRRKAKEMFLAQRKTLKIQ